MTTHTQNAAFFLETISHVIDQQLREIPKLLRQLRDIAASLVEGRVVDDAVNATTPSVVLSTLAGVTANLVRSFAIDGPVSRAMAVRVALVRRHYVDNVSLLLYDNTNVWNVSCALLVQHETSLLLHRVARCDPDLLGAKFWQDQVDLNDPMSHASIPPSGDIPSEALEFAFTRRDVFKAVLLAFAAGLWNCIYRGREADCGAVIHSWYPIFQRFRHVFGIDSLAQFERVVFAPTFAAILLALPEGERDMIATQWLRLIRSSAQRHEDRVKQTTQSDVAEASTFVKDCISPIKAWSIVEFEAFRLRL